MKKTELASFMLLLQVVVLFNLLNGVTAGPPDVEITATSQIDSPKNITYTSAEIPLNVVVTGDASERNYTVAYRIIYLNEFTSEDPVVLGTYLDDGNPKAFNSILYLEQDGQYELRVTISYATIGVYRQIYFAVQTNQTAPSPTPSATLEPTQSPEPQSEPFPAVPVVAFIASVIVVAVGLAICFRKRKSEAKTS